MTDQEIDKLLDSAARALNWIDYPTDSAEHGNYWHTDKNKAPFGHYFHKSSWNPSMDDGDCLRLAHKLRINIDMQEGYAWTRLPNSVLVGCFWGGEYDPNHRLAVLKVAAEIWGMGYNVDLLN